MKIDCTTCEVREVGCADCVVTLLMALPAPDQSLVRAEEQALAVMAESGLVPKLRLIQGDGQAQLQAPDSCADDSSDGLGEIQALGL